jgi:hypothetical protein
MTQMIRVFINSNAVDVAPGATALDAVRSWDVAVAEEVTAGGRVITDSRGLPLDAGAPMSAGSILRLTRQRDRAEVDAGDEESGTGVSSAADDA